jgi:putative sigma-54 modulation protein
MRLELTGRHLTITPATRTLVEERIAHTLRLLNDSAVSAHVVLTRDRARIHAEVTLHASRERFLHGEATGSNVVLALNSAADKIDGQARKLKGKRAQRKRRGPSAARTTALQAETQASQGSGATSQGSAATLGASAPRRRIIRARQSALKPMSVEDAAAEMDGGKGAFIVFRNSSTDAVMVLYRRPDGHLGLIEPEG